MTDPANATATPEAPAATPPAAPEPGAGLLDAGNTPAAAPPTGLTEQVPNPASVSPEAPGTPEAAPAATAPESYELSLGETPTLADSAVSQVEAHAREHGLSQDAAQATLALADQIAASHVQGAMDAHEVRVEGWEGEIKAHAKFGGPAFEAANIQANRGYQSNVIPEALREMLVAGGYHKHPAVFELMHNIGALTKDDGHYGGDAPTKAGSSMAERMYGDKPKG